jgi:hypothetical protein
MEKEAFLFLIKLIHPFATQINTNNTDTSDAQASAQKQYPSTEDFSGSLEFRIERSQREQNFDHSAMITSNQSDVAWHLAHDHDSANPYLLVLNQYINLNWLNRPLRYSIACICSVY